MNDIFIKTILKKGFFLIDDFLPHETYLGLRDIIKDIDTNGLARSAKIGPNHSAQKNDTIRSDAIFWLDENGCQEDIQCYFETIKAIKTLLNKNFYLGLSSIEAHFAIYQPGAFYKRHVDQFARNKDRVISCVYYLNENWQTEFGGNLQLYSEKNELLDVISPQGNRMVCFESHIPHEVTTANQIRYSIASWMKRSSLYPVL